ncbi:SusD-like starch-binding protein associating with outer membrane [Chitinophaga niastensis]|uniref:SusD-like starch-binding protein associating with outer membrane n=1 Tax=Chitinophaga niastensis TaxID=536980 RepID=A0A2P8HP00_CHINA|nr:RagB/SusD family nutrient uptake outer membrane protein [Chitinophaga niastensis]PSL47950.1 SusD-like starch-binding protein associating with outer membrane [Chitinophaga niastensis]
MKRIIYIVISALLLTGASCKKDLGKLPENAKVDGNTILDQRTAEIALNGVYYRFANVSTNNNNTTSWFEHEVVPGMFAGYLGYGYGPDPAEDNDYANSGYSDIYWSSSYALINAANGIIKGVTALEDKQFTGNRKKEILSEARFMRAYAHFKLLSYYGEWYDLSSPHGALLRNEFVTLANIAKKRSTVNESYAFILQDLDDAIANAAADRPDYYATRWTAMALKMRVMMSHGQPADYTTAINLADSIILNSHYALEPKAQDIFYTKGLGSKEVILGIQPQQNQETYYYNLSSQYWPGASALYVAKQALKDLLKNDPRESWLTGSANPSTDGTYYFLKYIAEGTKATPLSETAYAFRLTEVYLLKAEAIVRSGGSLAAARDILKNIMGHAGVADFTAVDNAVSQDQLLKQIYFEIAKNLVGEDGQEWMALLRLPFATVQQLRPSITDKIRYILPIPHAEFVSNPAIGDQNTGYQK